MLKIQKLKLMKKYFQENVKNSKTKVNEIH